MKRAQNMAGLFAAQLKRSKLNTHAIEPPTLLIIVSNVAARPSVVPTGTGECRRVRRATVHPYMGLALARAPQPESGLVRVAKHELLVL